VSFAIITPFWEGVVTVSAGGGAPLSWGNFFNDTARPLCLLLTKVRPQVKRVNVCGWGVKCCETTPDAQEGGGSTDCERLPGKCFINLVHVTFVIVVGGFNARRASCVRTI
jgi:hypothetical protein